MNTFTRDKHMKNLKRQDAMLAVIGFCLLAYVITGNIQRLFSEYADKLPTPHLTGMIFIGIALLLSYIIMIIDVAKLGTLHVAISILFWPYLLIAVLLHSNGWRRIIPIVVILLVAANGLLMKALL